MLNLNITAASHVGCVRTNNEDMLLVGDSFVRNSRTHALVSTNDTDRYMIALADGMGGHNSGEVASSDVLHNLQYFFSDIPAGLKPGDFNETIFEWGESINNIIDSKGHADPKYRDMGTTLVAMAYYAGEFYWMNCGDSRLYRLHDGKLMQLTTDHSLSNLLGSPKHSNVITNCIGGGCKTSYIDLVQCSADVLAGDTFMLCSDGLTDMVEDSLIEKMLIEGYDATSLCEAAEDAGGLDNVSVIIIQVE
jgi:protein phosphatase